MATSYLSPTPGVYGNRPQSGFGVRPGGLPNIRELQLNDGGGSGSGAGGPGLGAIAGQIGKLLGGGEGEFADMMKGGMQALGGANELFQSVSGDGTPMQKGLGAASGALKLAQGGFSMAGAPLSGPMGMVAEAVTPMLNAALGTSLSAVQVIPAIGTVISAGVGIGMAASNDQLNDNEKLEEVGKAVVGAVVDYFLPGFGAAVTGIWTQQAKSDPFGWAQIGKISTAMATNSRGAAGVANQMFKELRTAGVKDPSILAQALKVGNDAMAAQYQAIDIPGVGPLTLGSYYKDGRPGAGERDLIGQMQSQLVQDMNDVAAFLVKSGVDPQAIGALIPNVNASNTSPGWNERQTGLDTSPGASGDEVRAGSETLQDIYGGSIWEGLGATGGLTDDYRIRSSAKEYGGEDLSGVLFPKIDIGREGGLQSIMEPAHTEWDFSQEGGPRSTEVAERPMGNLSPTDVYTRVPQYATVDEGGQQQMTGYGQVNIDPRAINPRAGGDPNALVAQYFPGLEGPSGGLKEGWTGGQGGTAAEQSSVGRISPNNLLTGASGTPKPEVDTQREMAAGSRGAPAAQPGAPGGFGGPVQGGFSVGQDNAFGSDDLQKQPKMGGTI